MKIFLDAILQPHRSDQVPIFVLQEFQHGSTGLYLPCITPVFHLTSGEILGLQDLSSLKKHQPTSAQCPSHQEPHLSNWQSTIKILTHTHLYNSMTGFATSLYCLSLAATASGLSSSCWTNGSPVMSSIPYKYQRNQLLWPAAWPSHRQKLSCAKPCIQL